MTESKHEPSDQDVDVAFFRYAHETRAIAHALNDRSVPFVTAALIFADAYAQCEASARHAKADDADVGLLAIYAARQRSILDAWVARVRLESGSDDPGEFACACADAPGLPASLRPPRPEPARHETPTGETN